MRKKVIGLVLSPLPFTLSLLYATLFALCFSAEAGQPKVYRVGVIFHGGEWNAVVGGLQDGLRELGLKNFTLEVRNTKGNVKTVDEVARSLERDHVDLLYTVATSVTIRARKATADIPIVFCAGTDPVALGLVDSFARPGGRLTGVHFLATDLTAKRLEILKEMLPKLHRVVTFYDPGNPVAREASKRGRETSQDLKIEFVERHVASVKEFQAGLQALRSEEADAFLLVSDAMVLSQSELVIDTTKAKRLPTMFWEQDSVVRGGLASYGVNYHEAGRLSAKYVQRILTGTRPQDLPVETLHKIDLIFNLRTARDIGLTIPPNVLVRADKVIK
jgi:putative ABC transport system substrate-binding protein